MRFDPAGFFMGVLFVFPGGPFATIASGAFGLAGGGQCGRAWGNGNDSGARGAGMGVEG